ncbi:hypothetical protein GOBAR_AA32610 [Gossypium barbadense]|uniref:Uncharacterized protein n=1 Tax=Gossypium barbadense TaxID=3634 RepID=A0A2P5WAG1_GOSBA|nr:hypothetical protein GOBAR_AA32610 [Gossypium barbadense]
MVTKFILVSETSFQNTETALKNQQASIQGLKTQIGQLAKLISERPQGSLPSNTESNPMGQLNAIVIEEEEGLIAKPMPETMETVTKNAYEPCLNNNKGRIYEERRLQIEETPDKLKLSQDELNTSPNQLKVGDKVLLDAADPRLTTSEPNEEIPLTVLSIFPYGTVELIAGMRSVNSSHRLDHAEERVRFFPTRDVISCHGHVTWPWAKLPKQHGHETRPCLETMVETENVTQACDTSVPYTRGRHCQNEHGNGRSERSKTRPCDTVVCAHTPKPHGRGPNVKRAQIQNSQDTQTKIRVQCHPYVTIMTNSDDPGTVQFHLDSLVRQLSIPEFGIALGLGLIPAPATYDPSLSKASTLPPSLRYLQAILAHTLIGRRERTGVVTTHDAYFLWSMANRHGISSMLSMRMIEKRHDTYPPQYRLAQSTEEEDPEDIPDDVPPRHEDPPT